MHKETLSMHWWKWVLVVNFIFLSQLWWALVWWRIDFNFRVLSAVLPSPLARAALSSRQHLAPNFLVSNSIFPVEPRVGSVALLVSEAAPLITIPWGKGPTWTICNQFHVPVELLFPGRRCTDRVSQAPASLCCSLLRNSPWISCRSWFKRENQRSCRIQVLGKFSRFFQWCRLPWGAARDRLSTEAAHSPYLNKGDFRE